MNTIEVVPVNQSEKARPLWSVIIPAYNCLTYLKETIQSVLNQDRGLENMEIWVVDDCSEENPRALVEELGRGRIQFYRQQQNVGQLNNFNTGLNLSKGKIIHLLHGDDFVHDGFYKSLEVAFSADNGVGAAFTACNIMDGNGKIRMSSDLLADKPGIIPDFLSIITCRQVIQTPSVVVKREVYEKIGAFNKDLTWIEDWEMWIRIACHYDFYYVPQVLASYRIHHKSNTEESITSGRFIKDVLTCISVYSGYLKMPEKDKRQIINSAKQHYLTFAGYQSHKRASLSIFFRSFSLVYNVPSFFKVMYGAPKLLIKAALKRIKGLPRGVQEV